ncbi:MAG TPA: hypothetical protein VJT72_01285 [Pseudonocardiaceae bacterium]|nr:hypothetical protein [Pseudonocardiaceae bacterium]
MDVELDWPYRYCEDRQVAFVHGDDGSAVPFLKHTKPGPTPITSGTTDGRRCGLRVPGSLARTPRSECGTSPLLSAGRSRARTCPRRRWPSPVICRRPISASFGAFDFAVTTTGEWIMFECNPFGQYGWLEDALDLPITSALADLLEAGSRP